MPQKNKDMAKKRKASRSDRRVTIKLDPTLYRAVSSIVDEHPEWGITSVSDFVRRAIDHELTIRNMSVDRKVIEISLNEPSREDSQRKAP